MTLMGAGKEIDPRWERLQELFAQAVDLPEHERTQLILRETTDDPTLREELLDLLACDTGKSTGPLTNALGAALDATTRDRRRALLGKVVGNYKLVSVLGHGGTGTVYLGERSDRQYSAQVAVKIVDSATVQGDLGMRFRAERQILASLNHPNIARLLDAGETPDGQPYLVMEYVHGEPVDRYCDRMQLDIRSRLELFLQICAAVQYAHQNLIVHRDLKPANILVTGDGQPKLLDFGIAKLLDVGESASLLALTRMNDRLLTPEYASPEQILGRAVTTASDVYALGVVLYELLTGLRPYVVPASASQLELERSICVADPYRPSASISRVMDKGPVEGESNINAVALARGLSPERLQRRLSGDIDAIVMRSMRKEPEHRYPSIEQLTADVRRYLNQEAVLARQGNWLYYSQRFMRRHAFGVAASATFVTVIIAFAIAMTIQTQRIARERDRATQESERAEKVSNFMLNVFAASDPFENLGQQKTATDLLDQAARSIQGDLNEQPEVRARLLEAIGRAYRRQGKPSRAVAYLEDSLNIRGKLPTENTAQTGSVLTELAIAFHQDGKFEESDRAFRRAMEISENSANSKSVTYAHLLVDLGRLEFTRGNIDKGEAYLIRGLKLTRELEGSRHPEVASILNDLSNARAWHDDLAGAEKYAQEAVSIYRESVHERHPDRVMADFQYGQVLYLEGRMNDAGPLFEQTLTNQRLLFGTNSRQVANTLDALAHVRLAQDRIDDARKLAEEAVDVSKAIGANNFMTGYLQTSLAQVLTREQKYDVAEQQLREALDVYARSLPPDHQYIAASEYVLGEVLLATKRLPDAEAMLVASMNRWKRTDSSTWRAARSASALGEVLYREKRYDEAEKYLVEGYRGVGPESGADADTKRKARERITRFYTDRGQRHKLDELSLATSRDEIANRPIRPN
jgi:serine/threonine protein kinase/predicted negative regulator of RcsB-dependent stress response